MKKTVTLFCLVAMFVVASCASDTEPEPEPEAKMTLEERAGVYVKQDDKKIMFVLHTDGTAMYVNGLATSPTKITVGNRDSVDTTFTGVTIYTRLAGIVFNPNDPSEVEYHASVTTDANGESSLKPGVGDFVELTKVEF